MNTSKEKKQKRERRHRRIRAKITGTAKRPRLSVHKSNKLIRAQIIDDVKGVTFVSVISKEHKNKTMTDDAREAGKDIAKAALAKKITTVIFDRGGFLYTGKVKAFADGAREGGLIF